MRRKLMEKLKRWQKQTSGRLPLLLYGARQVGKTYLLKEFGASCFQNTVYLNLEEDKSLAAYLETDIRPTHILRVIEELYHVQILPGKTLLILDEIQSCARALTALKYFAEEAHDYFVVAAGSLLGVVLSREQESFPVGKVQLMTMYPLDMEEFLWARGKSLLAETIRKKFQSRQPLPAVLHTEALNLYQEYLICGGMPAVVAAEPFRAAEIKQFIYKSYVADMTKYTGKSEGVHIAEAYDSLPAQLAKENKKFQYKLIRSGGRAALYGSAIDWLIQSGVVLKCTKCNEGLMPPAAYEDLSSFKLYFSDTGIFSARTGMTLVSLAASSQFMGALTENYVAVALKTAGYNLNYWASQSQAEVDFVIVREGALVPVECKADVHVKSKSLATYVKRYEPPYAIRLSARNLGFENQILSLPLYAVFCLAAAV